jgi:hypothetical protein
MTDEHYKAIAVGSMLAKAVAGAFGRGELERGVVFITHKDDSSFAKVKHRTNPAGGVGKLVLGGEFFAAFLPEGSLDDAGLEKDPLATGKVAIFTFCGTEQCVLLAYDDLVEVAKASKEYFGVEFTIGGGEEAINSKGGEA